MGVWIWACGQSFNLRFMWLWVRDKWNEKLWAQGIFRYYWKKSIFKYGLIMFDVVFNSQIIFDQKKLTNYGLTGVIPPLFVWWKVLVKCWEWLGIQWKLEEEPLTLTSFAEVAFLFIMVEQEGSIHLSFVGWLSLTQLANVL